MHNIEQQMSQVQEIRKSLNTNQTHVAKLDAEVSTTIIIRRRIFLFQEDNIFGTNCRLTYGPWLQKYKWHWHLHMHKLFTVCTDQVRSPYTEHAASGLPNPTQLEGEVRFDQAQSQQVVTTRSPRIVTECLLTRSMLIKIYVYDIYSRFRIGTILSIWIYHYTITIEFHESFQS